MNGTVIPYAGPFSTITPSLSPAFIAVDHAAAYANDLIGDRRDVEYGGFLLSKDDQYYATLPVRSEGYLFRPDSVLSKGLSGDILPPEGYVIEGMYHSHVVFPRPLLMLVSESDLQENFFSLMDLRTAIAFRHNYPRFYLATPDKSLICYVSTDSAQERALQPLLMLVHSGVPGHLEQSYPTGLFLPSHLLSMVYIAGEFSVVKAGSFWRRRGRIGADWQAQRDAIPRLADQPPLCSPVFDTLSAAAQFAHTQMQTRPGVQHAGFILKQGQRAAYLCTRPQVARYAEFDRPVVFARDIHGMPQLPAGYQVVGVYHSADEQRAPLAAAQSAVGNDFFSPDNIFDGLMLMRATLGLRVYFSAPQGALLSYRRTSVEAESALLVRVTRVDAASSGLEQDLVSGRLPAIGFVHQVAAAGRLEVMVTDAVWAQAGRVTSQWQPGATVG